MTLGQVEIVDDMVACKYYLERMSNEFFVSVVKIATIALIQLPLSFK
jgi:hypothetical protein